jgi:TM2 domain-containing membrane protein YozV
MSDETPVAPAANPRGINAFVLNLIIPGLGSLYAGRWNPGAIQLGLFVLGILSLWSLFGLALIVAAWIWSATFGYRLLQS